MDRFFFYPLTSVSAASINLNLGQVALPSISFTPTNATDKSYNLTSSDSSIVSIKGDSLIGVKQGTATITLTTNDRGWVTTFSAHVITVTVPVASLSALDMVLIKGQDTLPAIGVLPVTASDKTYSLISSNLSVVAIAGDTLKAINLGNAQITISSHDGSAQSTFQVTVQAAFVPVTSVSASPISLAVGQTVTPAVTVAPSDATNIAYTLASGGAGVTVSGHNLFGVSVGTTLITITSVSGSVTGTFNATVQPIHPTSITVAAKSLFKGGSSLVIAPTILPSASTDQTFSMVSSSNCVIVDNAAKTITGICDVVNTSVSITATDNSTGTAASSFNVTVTTPVIGLTVSGATSIVHADGWHNTSVVWNPSSPTNTSYSLASSNASVLISGTLYYGQSRGSATVTATSSDGTKTNAFSVIVKANFADVAAITSVSCNSCHVGNIPSGAPQKSWADETIVRADVVNFKSRINSSTIPMPPSGQLTPATLAVLNEWLAVNGL